MSEDDRSKEGEEMGLRFDNKISTGHILTAAALFASGVAGFTHVKSEVAKVSAEVAAISSDAKQSEARIRAVEIAQASQSSDLRSIQGGIARIEMQLEKLSKN
jgi:hypothetical protein